MLWARTSLGPGLVELAICHHRPLLAGPTSSGGPTRRAPSNSASPLRSRRCAGGAAGPTGRPQDELVYDLCQTMHETHALPRGLFDRGVAAFGEQGVAELDGGDSALHPRLDDPERASKIEVGPGLVAPFKARALRRRPVRLGVFVQRRSRSRARKVFCGGF